jgi:hypothetical protein
MGFAKNKGAQGRNYWKYSTAGIEGGPFKGKVKSYFKRGSRSARGIVTIKGMGDVEMNFAAETMLEPGDMIEGVVRKSARSQSGRRAINIKITNR